MVTLKTPKLYYTLDEAAATILDCNAEDILHLGTKGQAELLIPLPEMYEMYIEVFSNLGVGLQPIEIDFFGLASDCIKHVELAPYSYKLNFVEYSSIAYKIKGSMLERLPSSSYQLRQIDYRSEERIDPGHEPIPTIITSLDLYLTAEELERLKNDSKIIENKIEESRGKKFYGEYKRRSAAKEKGVVPSMAKREGISPQRIHELMKPYKPKKDW